jgi:ATP-dependent helicase HrpA
MDPLDDAGTAPDSPATPPADDLRTRIGALTLRDEARLRRRLQEAEHGPGQSRGRRDGRGGRGRPKRVDRPWDIAAQLARLAADVEKAEARLAARQVAVPRVSYPPQLPVSQRRDDLLEAIRDHQVVVVAGETGSGKTTQLPKICLELGRGVRGLIGHTQPRRIARWASARWSS